MTRVREGNCHGKRRAICVLSMLTAVLAGAIDWHAASASDATTFTPSEIRLALTLGPWPAPWHPDPSNRVSGNEDAIALGRLLFFDARLSGQGTHSCSSCHRPEMAWTDGRAIALGLAPSRRNTPSLFNVRYRRWFGWDGSADSLWAQSMRPILDPREMGSSAEHVRAHIAGNAALADLYSQLFARAAATTSAEDVLVDAAKVLAAFQETLVSPRTPFDDFRDAHARGDDTAAASLPEAAVRGLKLFVGAGACVGCHAGPLLAGDTFAILQPVASGQGPMDRGRAEGIERLLRSPYTLYGHFSDHAGATVVWKPGDLHPAPSDNGAFRVPSLRTLKSTAPYLHDGRASTLRDAIAAHGGSVAALSRDDQDALVAFLEMLTR